MVSGAILKAAYSLVSAASPSYTWRPPVNQTLQDDLQLSALVFNRKLNNFQELRLESEKVGNHFRSRSDAEVALQALNTWGTEVLDRLNGILALAWYDQRNQQLLLERDHAGIKPLYVFLHPAGKDLVFASQYDLVRITPWGHPGALNMESLLPLLTLTIPTATIHPLGKHFPTRTKLVADCSINWMGKI